MIKRIHVNMHHIRYNIKHEDKKPVIAVKTSKSNIYSPDKPLSCGARLWIETTSEVDIK